jgi:hypothetical protein
MPVGVEENEIGQQPRVVVVCSYLAVREGVALCVEMCFELSSLIVEDELFLYACDLETCPRLVQLLINRGPQDFNPIFELDKVRKIYIVLFLNERKPIYFADAMIVSVVSVLKVPICSLDVAVNKVLLVLFLDPLHLGSEGNQELIVEHLLVDIVVCAL